MLTTNSLRTFAAADISSLFLTKINHLAKVFKPKSYLSLPISLGYERDLRKLIKFKFRFSIGTNILNMQTFLSESGPDSAQLNSHLAAPSSSVFVGEQEYTITEKHGYLHKCSDVIHYEIENVAALLPPVHLAPLLMIKLLAVLFPSPSHDSSSFFTRPFGRVQMNNKIISTFSLALGMNGFC